MLEAISLQLNKLHFKYPGNKSFRLHTERLDYRFISPLGIYGLSGSGKTTLGKILAGIIDLQSGKKNFSCHNSNINFAALDILYSPQFPENLFLGNKIKDTLQLISNRNQKFTGLYKKIKEVLGFFDIGLVDIINKNGYALSSGELRRFALALNFACEPDVLILDEPTISLGSRGKSQLQRIIKRRQKYQALIVITHDFKFLKNVCDFLWIMDSGEIIFNGNFSELSTNVLIQKRAGLPCYLQLKRKIELRKKELSGILIKEQL